MDHVISELWDKGIILQRNYRKINILWSFSFNFFVKFHRYSPPLGVYSPALIITSTTYSTIPFLHCVWGP